MESMRFWSSISMILKGINDDYGHRLGDSVIAALGSEINHIFRTSDIKGRIGGDDLWILIKDVDGMDRC